MFAAGFGEVLADAPAQRLERLKFTQLFGELVIERRHKLALDSEYLHPVRNGLARQAAVAELRRIDDIEADLLAQLRPAQVLRELRHGVGSADLAEDFFQIDSRPFFPGRIALNADTGVVAILDRARLHVHVAGRW